MGAIELAGTITGGTITDSGGGLNLSAGTGVLDHVAYQGSLVLGQNAILTLADSTTLSTGASITGSGAALLLESLTGAQTMLDNATITLGSSSGQAAIGTTDSWLASAATTAVLGAHLVVQQTGNFAAIDANATTPIVGYGLSDVLVNDGTITGGIAGGTLSLGGAGTWINDASITISNGDTLVAGAMDFANAGTLTVNSGASAILGGPVDAFGQAPVWSNTGVIDLNGGTLVLSGVAQTAGIGSVVSNGSSASVVSLAGTLENTSSTLTLGRGGMLPSLSLSGTIQGGTIADASGVLAAGTSGTALLDGVTYDGTLNLGNAGARLRIEGGLALSGTAAVTGAGADLGFQGSQTIDKATVLLGASGSAATLDVLHDGTVNGPSILTLGPNLVVNQAGALADIGAPTDNPADGISAYGTINAAISHGVMDLGSASFANHGKILVSNGDTLILSAGAFSNTGTIGINGASMDIADEVSMAALGRLQLSNAQIAISGTLLDAGGTLAIGAGSAWGRVSLTGTISGGGDRR